MSESFICSEPPGLLKYILTLLQLLHVSEYLSLSSSLLTYAYSSPRPWYFLYNICSAPILIRWQDLAKLRLSGIVRSEHKALWHN
jgi:hypothetical protein